MVEKHSLESKSRGAGGPSKGEGTVSPSPSQGSSKAKKGKRATSLTRPRHADTGSTVNEHKTGGGGGGGGGRRSSIQEPQPLYSGMAKRHPVALPSTTTATIKVKGEHIANDSIGHDHSHQATTTSSASSHKASSKKTPPRSIGKLPALSSPAGTSPAPTAAGLGGGRRLSALSDRLTDATPMPSHDAPPPRASPPRLLSPVTLTTSPNTYLPSEVEAEYASPKASGSHGNHPPAGRSTALRRSPHANDGLAASTSTSMPSLPSLKKKAPRRSYMASLGKEDSQADMLLSPRRRRRSVAHDKEEGEGGGERNHKMRRLSHVTSDRSIGEGPSPRSLAGKRGRQAAGPGAHKRLSLVGAGEEEEEEEEEGSEGGFVSRSAVRGSRPFSREDTSPRLRGSRSPAPIDQLRKAPRTLPHLPNAASGDRDMTGQQTMKQGEPLAATSSSDLVTTTDDKSRPTPISIPLASPPLADSSQRPSETLPPDALPSSPKIPELRRTRPIYGLEDLSLLGSLEPSGGHDIKHKPSGLKRVLTSSTGAMAAAADPVEEMALSIKVKSPEEGEAAAAESLSPTSATSRSSSSSSSSSSGGSHHADGGRGMVGQGKAVGDDVSEVLLSERTKGLSRDELRTVAVFVPSLVLQLVLTDGTYQPFSFEVKEAAIVLVDLSGFTALCEACANGTMALEKDATAGLDFAATNAISASALGAKIYRLSNQAEVEGFGAENVRDILNKYFGVLVEVIYCFGGDVIRIAGDALICMFSSGCLLDGGLDSSALPALSPRSKAMVVERSIRSAQECVRVIEQMKTPEIPLHVHVGVGWGNVTCYHVGSDDYGWQMVVSGDPLTQVGTALEVAKAGEIVVSAAMWEQIRPLQDGVMPVQVAAEVGELRKLHILDSDTSHLSEEDGVVGSMARSSVIGRIKAGQLSEAGKQRLLGYTPILLHAGVLEEGTGLQSEIRTVTVLFLMVDAKALQHQGVRMVDTLQAAFDMAQASIVEHEGVIKELSVDDKGLVLVAGFGLNAVMNQNSASQACKCALRLALGMNLMKLGANIGLSTGRVFCASLGNRQRREFALVSDTVNVAARLMVLGKKTKENQLDLEQLRGVDASKAHQVTQDLHSSVVLEKQTYLRAQTSNSLEFSPRTPVLLKGKTQSIEVFVPGFKAQVGREARHESHGEVAVPEDLNYDRFLAKAPQLFQEKEVDEQLLDILWVRCQGNTLYLDHLIKKIRCMGVTKIVHGRVFLNSTELSTVQAVASIVPDGVQEIFSRRLACLPRAYLIVLKVMAVVGEGSAGIIHYLFENHSSLARYWSAQKSNRKVFYSPAASADDDDGAQVASTVSEFVTVMKVLAQCGFIVYDVSGESYSLREPLLVDYLYTSIPFRMRTQLHGRAAEWFLEYTQTDLTYASLLYPLVIHHFNLSFQESRSASILKCVHVLGPTYIDNWIRLRLSESTSLSDVAERCSTVACMISRFLACLTAFPWYRGLARVIQADRVGNTVVSFVTLLKHKLVRRVQEKFRAARAARRQFMAARIQVAYRRWRKRAQRLASARKTTGGKGPY